MEYIASADQKAIGERHKRTALVVAALGASVIVYVALAWLIPRSAAAPQSQGWKNTFYFVALGVGLGAVVLLRLLLSRFRLEAAAKQGVSAVLGNLSLASILGAGLGDAVGLLGLVACLLTGDREFSWRLGLVGLALVIYSYPRRWEWERAVSAAPREQHPGARI